MKRRLPQAAVIGITMVGTILGTRLFALTQQHFGSAREAPASVATAAAPAAKTEAANYYPVTLIGEDGSRTALKGTDLQIDLGNERILEIHLDHHRDGMLRAWSPLKREDTHWNAVVFHPYCANSFAINLERHAVDPDATDSLNYGRFVTAEDDTPEEPGCRS